VQLVAAGVAREESIAPGVTYISIGNIFVFNMLQDATKSNTFNSTLAPIVLLPRQFVSYFLSLFWGRATKVQQDRASSETEKSPLVCVALL
jgi:hypothetical protein